ncbi:hydrolase [Mariprofundus sp. NF]|uniref:hydrolase n=1 Tax=Mariprofundus sp. NF TaxID=2608716 RepID=UPI0015A331D6|nr:hydrolase [Mariprofundus sp. NF]NWF39193.1 hydrolase [Mariprofundus sp. NF]
MPIIQSKFKPAWWLRSGHAQTLWPKLFRLKPKMEMAWQRVELIDGDFIDLVWSGPKEGRTVLLLHGLEGNINSPYILGLMHELELRGYRSCLMHFRGCSGEPNRLSESYHSGKTADPQQILWYLKEHMDIDLYAAIGVSLGGNVLLKWLGEQGCASSLKRAAVMSVPFSLGHAAERMNRGFSRFYQWHLIRSLQKGYKNKFARIPSPLSVDVDGLDSFRLFDDQVTAPLNGFKGADDYYTQVSSRQFIPDICVPTLILHAVDDPFMFPYSVPHEDELPENVWLELVEHGGHAGFISGVMPGQEKYWGEQRLVEWIDSV